MKLLRNIRFRLNLFFSIRQVTRLEKRLEKTIKRQQRINELTTEITEILNDFNKKNELQDENI